MGGGCYESVLNHCTLTENDAAFGGGSYGGTLSHCILTRNGTIYSGGGSFGGNQDPDRMGANGVNTVRDAYIAGLDPTDPDSKFRASFGSDQVLRWNATSGRVYSVWCSTNLLSGFHCLEPNIPWTAGGFTNDVHPAEEQLFYKVDVQLDESL